MKTFTAFVLLIVMAQGCGGGPTAPAPGTPAPTRTARPTPTAVPVPNVAGHWSGAFVGLLFCQGRGVSASATLSQNGSQVNGTLRTICNQPILNGDIEGAFTGAAFIGRFTGNGLTLKGTASESRFTLTLENGFGSGTWTFER